MKNSSLNEVLVDLSNLIETVDNPQMATKEKSKYTMSFSNDFEVFEDVDAGIIYENTNGELLLDIINKKDRIFSILMEYIAKTKESIKTIHKAVVFNLFDHYQYIEKLREDLEKCDINQSIINMLCDDLNYYVNTYIQEQESFLNEYNSNRKDELDLEELLSNEEKLKMFVELDDFDEYFEHDKSDLHGVKKEIRQNIRKIEEENTRLINRNNNLLSGILNYLYSITTFFIIVDNQVDRRTKSSESIEELLIEPLNIPRSETNFEKIPNISNSKNKQMEGQFQIITKYEIQSLDELLNIYIRDMMENKIKIKKCEDCGRYFFPTAKQIYCSNCRDNSYEVRKNTSAEKLLYRNNYKNQHNKMRRGIEKNPELKDSFDKWNRMAKTMLSQCEEGKISYDEFNEWFERNSELKKF